MAKPKDKTIEVLLKEAGFTTVTVVNNRVIHAKVSNDKAFDKAHAAFVQASRKHPALVGASRLSMATGSDILVVHVQAVAAQPEPQNHEPEAANAEPKA